ncbi:conserved hypothetical protein [Bosea sp. 125]|nr:conserved hypothetical protein [Bosea sp. 125]
MTACWTAASSSSPSESAPIAIEQFISLGNSRQSMNLRPMASSRLEDPAPFRSKGCRAHDTPKRDSRKSDMRPDGGGKRDYSVYCAIDHWAHRA